MGRDVGRDVTVLLERWRDGDIEAGEQAMALLYPEIKKLAVHAFLRERADHTLQPTAVVHEAYIRMARGGGMDASGTLHFLALTARVIRQVLVDHSRERNRRKRGGADLVRIELDEGLLEHAATLDFIDLDRALEKLAEIDAQGATIVELKYLGGLTVNQIAAYMGISAATVSRKWLVVRAWLRGELSPERDP